PFEVRGGAVTVTAPVVSRSPSPREPPLPHRLHTVVPQPVFRRETRHPITPRALHHHRRVVRVVVPITERLEPGGPPALQHRHHVRPVPDQRHTRVHLNPSARVVRHHRQYLNFP